MQYNLSQLERLNLVNQFRLLSLTEEDEERKGQYKVYGEIFECGYTPEYHSVLDSITPHNEMTDDDYSLVANTLQMYSALYLAIERNMLPQVIDKSIFTFRGFHDCFAESNLLRYTEFIIRRAGRHRELDGECLDWYREMSPTYKAMLKTWRGSEDRDYLRSGDLQRIASVIISLDSAKLNKE